MRLLVRRHKPLSAPCLVSDWDGICTTWMENGSNWTSTAYQRESRNCRDGRRRRDGSRDSGRSREETAAPWFVPTDTPATVSFEVRGSMATAVAKLLSLRSRQWRRGLANACIADC